MKRTQIQIPDPLYDEVKRVADLQEWSVTEVLRRGAEHMIRCYPPHKTRDAEWRPPSPRAMGAFRAPAERWRELANEPDPDTFASSDTRS